MTDDPRENQEKPRRRRRASRAGGSSVAPAGAGGSAEAPPPGGGAEDDPLAALERLQALSSPGAAARESSAEAGPAPAPGLAPPVDGSRRWRPALSPSTTRTVTRFAAPAVFLVAVIALVSIFFQSGIIGGSGDRTVAPAPSASATQTQFKMYRVKKGDTLSGIAMKFNTTTDDLRDLNPDMSASTVVVGEKIRVPLPAP